MSAGEDDGFDIEAITDTIEQCLTGESGFTLVQAGFATTSLSDLGEIYIRTPGGKHFKMLLEEVSADDVEGWGITFDE